MPLVAPVTKATFPSNLLIVSSLVTDDPGARGPCGPVGDQSVRKIARGTTHHTGQGVVGANIEAAHGRSLVASRSRRCQLGRERGAAAPCLRVRAARRARQRGAGACV